MNAAQLQIVISAADKASSTIGGLRGKLQNFAGRAKEWGTKLSAGVTLPVAALGVASVKAASDLEEAINKANVTFGKSAGIVAAFAQDSADKFGISKRAAFEYTATLGNILQASGLSKEASAGMSVELTKLAADMASFNNIPFDVALEKIRSGLVGEAEPLRSVGVLLSENRIKTLAYEKGIAKAGEELTEQQKVQARYAAILEDTANQQGDFTRTSDSLANTQRRLGARFEDLRAELGQKLMPIAEKLLGWAMDALDAFSGLPGPVQNIIIVVALLAAALGPLLLVFAAIVSIAPALAAAWAVAFGSVGLIILAIIALIAVGILVWKNWDTIKEKAIAIWGRIKELFFNTLGSIRDFFLGIWDKIKSFLDENWQEILSIALLFLTGPGGLVALFSTNAFGIRDKVAEAFNSLKTFFTEDIKSFFTDTVPGWFGTMGDNIVSAAKGGLNDLLSAVETAINWILSELGGIGFSIPGWVPKVGGKGWHFSDVLPSHIDLPELQLGGLVTKTGLAVVHRGEVFSGVGPGAALRGDTVVTVNVTVNGSLIGSSPRELAAALQPHIEESWRLRRARGI